jgi:DnaJ-class molecular chaperone
MGPLSGNAGICPRCGGRGEVPQIPGDYSVVIRCPKCKGRGVLQPGVGA